MVKFDRSAFIDKFKEEASEHLQKLNEGIISLETEPDNTEIMTELMRSAHTLKGSSKMVGLLEISEIAHKIEDLFIAIKEKKLKIGGDVSDTIFNALDAIMFLTNEAAPDKELKFDTQGAIAPISKLLGEETSEEKVSSKEPIQEVTNDEKTEDKEDSTKESKSDKFIYGDKAEKKIIDKVQKTSETIRVKTNQIDTILNLVGEIVINQIKAEQRQSDLKSIFSLFDNQMEDILQLEELIISGMADVNGETRQKVTDTLHKIKNSFSIGRQDSNQLYKEFSEDISQMNLVVNELQEKGMGIRMLPIGTIFNSYPRAVRDLAKEFDKEVELTIMGEDTELDKKVLEELNDPLIHLVRNAIDHGLETPNQRVEKNKDPKGKIVLAASQEGDHIVIEVSDDGRGIDPEKVKNSAIKKGFISEAEMDTFEEKDIYYLLFESGFSTSSIITDVSGRGVGMDVVKKKIEEELKGSVQVESKLNEGTRFTLMLPLTLAIIRALLVKAGGKTFAIPTTALEETLKLKKSEIQKVKGKEAFQLRGSFIPLVKLSKIIGLDDNEHDDGKVSVVIINSGGHRIGFKVNDFIHEQQIVIKTLGNHLKKIPNIAGTTILGAGEIVIILHIPDLMASAREMAGLKTWRKTKGDKAKDKVRILVVEDSLTTRELEKNIFEAAGYSVEMAMDGTEALTILQQTDFDLVVTDVQMPAMNGFELTEAIKNNERLKEIPVVILTSLESEAEKQKGVDAGADAYIVKSSFDQASLLNTIQRLT